MAYMYVCMLVVLCYSIFFLRYFWNNETSRGNIYRFFHGSSCGLFKLFYLELHIGIYFAIHKHLYFCLYEFFLYLKKKQRRSWFSALILFCVNENKKNVKKKFINKEKNFQMKKKNAWKFMKIVKEEIYFFSGKCFRFYAHTTLREMVLRIFFFIVSVKNDIKSWFFFFKKFAISRKAFFIR